MKSNTDTHTHTPTHTKRKKWRREEDPSVHTGVRVSKDVCRDAGGATEGKRQAEKESTFCWYYRLVQKQ